MNKILPFCAGISMLTIFACKKAPLKEDTPNLSTTQVINSRENMPGSISARLNESTLAPVTIGTSGTYSGQYISAYSDGGVTFGLNLPHPTDDPTGIYDGYPIVGSIDFVNYMVTTVPCNTIINGAYFTIFEPTFPTTGLIVAQSTVNSIKAYDDAIKAVLDQPYSLTVTEATKKAQLANIPNPSITVTVNGPGTFLVVRGMLIRDHTSPTMMSIVTDKFVTPPVPDGSLYLIGAQQVNGYECLMSSPTNPPQSGPITNVTVKQSGNIIPVASFSLNYTGSENYGFHTFGTITLASNTVLTIDSWRYP